MSADKFRNLQNTEKLRAENATNPEQTNPDIPATSEPTTQKLLPPPTATATPPEMNQIGRDQTRLKVSFDANDAEALRRISLDDPAPSGDYAEALQAMRGPSAQHNVVYVDPDQYFEQFCFIFDAAYHTTAVLPDNRCPTLESLRISEPEKQGARAASDALYALAVKYPSILGWSLKPMGSGLQAAFPLVAFAWAKLNLIKAEIAKKAPGFLARRAAKKAGKGILGRFKGKTA